MQAASDIIKERDAGSVVVFIGLSPGKTGRASARAPHSPLPHPSRQQPHIPLPGSGTRLPPVLHSCSDQRSVLHRYTVRIPVCIGGPSFRRRKLGLAGSYQRIAETAIACSAAAGLKNGSCSESGLLPADSRRPEKGGAAGTPSPDFTEELRGTLEMTYRAENSGAPVPTEAQITAILKKMGKNSPDFRYC